MDRAPVVQSLDIAISRDKSLSSEYIWDTDCVIQWIALFTFRTVGPEGSMDVIRLKNGLITGRFA